MWEGLFRVGAGGQRTPLSDRLRKDERQQRVGTSSWQNGEAAVHRRLTLERQMNSTLLPDCAINPPAARAEVEALRPKKRLTA